MKVTLRQETKADYNEVLVGMWNTLRNFMNRIRVITFCYKKQMPL